MKLGVMAQSWFDHKWCSFTGGFARIPLRALILIIQKNQWLVKKCSWLNTYLAKLAYGRNGSGPSSNALPAVSAKVSDGIFACRHTRWDVSTCAANQTSFHQYNAGIISAIRGRNSYDLSGSSELLSNRTNSFNKCWNCELKSILTKIWTQCVQTNPMISVPSAPNSRPEFLNAIGMAKIPVPRELFSKCSREPNVLFL